MDDVRAPAATPRGDRTDALAPLDGRPMTVLFDVSNKCNLRCRMCYFSYDSVFHRRAVHMRPETFERIAGRLLPLAHTVFLSAGSESLTSPHFAEILRIAGRHGLPEMKLLTNGLLLTPELDDALIAAGMTQLHVSIDGATRATYEHVRRGGDFEVLRANLRRFSRRKRELGSAKPVVQFNVTLMRSNLFELDAFVDLALDVGATQIACRHLMPYAGLDMEAETTSHDPRRANERFAAFLDHATRSGIRVTSFPDFYAVDGAPWIPPLPAEVAPPEQLEAADRPFGRVDAPASALVDAEGSLEIAGWALSARGIAGVEIRRDVAPDDPEDADPTHGVHVGWAKLRNGLRPDVAARHPHVPHSWRGGWTFEVVRADLPLSLCTRVRVRVVAHDRDGRAHELDRREVRFGRGGARPFLFCKKPFDNVYVDAAANVYPYPDCQTVDPFGSLAGAASFQDVWFGDQFRELRQRIVDRDPPRMCVTCPDFINRSVDDPAFFAVRAVERDFRLPTGFVDEPVDGTLTAAPSIELRGWALSFAGVERIEVWRERDARDPPGDGGLVLVRTVTPATEPRPDVAARHRRYPDADLAGWRATLTREELGGALEARLRIRAVNVEGGSAEIGAARVRFVPPAPRVTAPEPAAVPFGAIDRPRDARVVAASGVELVGWALSADGPARVVARRYARVGEQPDADGLVDVAVARPHRKRRPDVLARHPALARHDRCGWRLHIAAAQLGPAGRAEIFVFAEDALGRATRIGSRVLRTAIAPAAPAPAASTGWIPSWMPRP